jgi:hypothetical protein
MQTPRNPGDITSAWLTHALREGGVLPAGGEVVGVDARVIGEAVGFLSCVARVALEYDGAPPDAPTSVIVKLEPGAGTFRTLGDQLHAFEREIRFYREIAPTVPVRLARLYYADTVPPDFAMVMEDLGFATPGDQVAGMHAGQVLATARVVGRLQARYWNNEAVVGLEWMPLTNAVELDYRANWPSLVEHFGAVIGPAGLGVGARLCDAVDWLEAEIERRPRTIVHSDLRADNLLFGAPDTDDAVLIVDWQLAIRSMGAFDIARLMGDSELPEERRGHHFDVLRSWHEALLAEGVRDYPYDAAVRDFRLGILAALFYPVHFHKGVIGATDRARALVEAICRRLFSAAVEIDAASVLP